MMAKSTGMLGILMLLFLNGCSQMKRDKIFLEKVLSDFSRNSYFVAINRETSNKESAYVIKNDDLYFYCRQVNNLSEADYKKKMVLFLSHDSSLRVSQDDIKKYHFHEVVNDSSILAMKKKNIDLFLNTYFNGKVLKNGIEDKTKYQIIKTLYDWNIGAQIDDETGYLIIRE